MTLSTLDTIIIIAFFGLSLAVGLYFKNRSSGNLSNFILGGRNIPWYLAGISMVATTFAADTPLAVTELVYGSGISGNWLWWCFLSGGMLTVFFFSHLWRRAGILTEVELLELRYGGAPARWLRGFKSLYLGIFMNVMILAWVNLALMALLQGFFNLTQGQAFLWTGAAMLIASGYSALGGLWGVTATDALQFILAMTGSIVLAVLVINSPEIGGMSGLIEKSDPERLRFFPRFDGWRGSDIGMGIGAFLAYIGVQWWASWYPGAEPGGGGYIAQRMMSTPKESDAVKATLLFQIAHYGLRPWPWILVALAGVILYPELGEANARMAYVQAMVDFLPSGWRGLMLTAFFAAYMSTVSTQLNWGTGYVVHDFVCRFIAPNAPSKTTVVWARWTTLILMALALGATTIVESISGVWSFIIECGAGLGLVLILRWYWWRINAWSEITATAAPFLFYTIGRYLLELDFPERFFFTVAATTLSWLAITFLTKPESPSTLSTFVHRVRPEGSWGAYGTQSSRLLRFRILGWISAVVFTYSILFGVGSILLHQPNDATSYAATAVIGLVFTGLSLYKLQIGTKDA